jgi:hypothetical protein
MNNKYQNGKIYKITGNGLIYIGSTTETLQKRLNRHLHYINENRYCSSSKCLTGNDYKIELLELCPCNTREELLDKEYFWYSNTINCNDVSPKCQGKDYKKIYNNLKNNPEAYQRQLERNRKYKKNKKSDVYIKKE